MRNSVCIVILITRLNCLGQFNLVPNGSFETYTSCPSTTNQLPKAMGWINPTSSGSPDYYNGCSSFISVPYCGGTPCFQYAKAGIAYSGVYGYDGLASNLREYAQIQLSTSLTNGKCYFVGFYTNEANWCGLGCNNLGAYLSNNQINLTGPSWLLNYPTQIKGFGNKINRDTLNWNFIGGIFQATNNEQYITIGNFNTDATTDTLTFNSSAVAPKYAYYYIDDVFVIPIDSIPGGMPAFAGNNVTINSGDSAFIGQQISNLNCNWYNGTVQIATNTSGLYVKPVTTTTYVVQQNLCGNITNDTVVVTVGGLGIKDDAPIAIGIRISPNPNNGILNVEILNDEFKIEDAELRIVNVLGQEIKRYKLQNKKQQIDLQEIEGGMFYLHLQKFGKTISAKKIVKL